MHIMKNRNYYLFIGVVLLTFFCISLDAQTIVRGKVIDKETGEPLIAVQVFSDGTSAFAESDNNGNYKMFRPLPIGPGWH